MSIESITLTMLFASGLFVYLAYKIPEEKVWMPLRVLLILLSLSMVPISLRLGINSLASTSELILPSLNLAYNISLIVAAVSLIYVMGIVVYHISIATKEVEVVEE